MIHDIPVRIGLGPGHSRSGKQRVTPGTPVVIGPDMRLAAAVLLVPAIATAEPPGLTPPAAPLAPQGDQPLVESYRAQVVAADALASLASLAAAHTHTPGVGVIGLATYVLGAPLVHLAHGRGTRALGSVALRVGLPLATVGVIAATRHPDCSASADVCDDADLGALMIGLAGSLVAASVIDAVFLAEGDEPPPARSWAPTLAPTTSGGLTLGVGGAF